MADKTLKERAAALWEPGTDSHLKALDAILFGVVSIAAVGAFVFQSFERFADREHLFLGGMFTIFAPKKSHAHARVLIKIHLRLNYKGQGD